MQLIKRWVLSAQILGDHLQCKLLAFKDKRELYNLAEGPSESTPFHPLCSGPKAASTPSRQKQIPSSLKPDAKIILTHIARKLQPPHAEMEKTLLPEGLIPAYDGMSVVLT